MSQGPERYARALCTLTSADKDASRVHKEIEAFSHFLRQNPVVERFFVRPRLSRASKIQALQALAKEAGWHPLTLSFFSVVARNGRFSWLSTIVAEASGLAKKRDGIVDVTICSAEPLSAANLTSLSKAITAGLGSPIDLTHHVHSELLHGFTMQIGSLLIDNSARAKLVQLKNLIEGNA